MAPEAEQTKFNASPGMPALLLRYVRAHPGNTMVVVFLIIPALLLLAFGPRANSKIPLERRNDVIVSYWEKWTGNEAAQMQQIVDDFNNTIGARKHIYVQYLSMSSIDQKTRLSMAAGVPPDIAGVWDGNLIQYAAEGALEPLENLARDAGITAGTYKKVYWDACNWHGHLWCLISTPMAVALHYNKVWLASDAAKLRAIGLDPTRPPQTIDELDRYATALNTFTVDSKGVKHLDRAGYLPMEPGWYVTFTPIWFGAPDIFDPATGKFNLTDPRTVAAFTWVQSYSKELGKDSITEFQSASGGFATAQNPFLAGTVVMEQQGPWMANYIMDLKPDFMGVMPDGTPVPETLPRAERQRLCSWAAAPFPGVLPNQDISYCGFDALVIPRGAKHPKEAFEFIAFVNTQREMEKLCSLHSKNSPLQAVSAGFIDHHRNPYIDVFEKLSRSPNARGIPQIPIGPEVASEMGNMVQQIYRLEKTPEDALRGTQTLLQAKYDDWLRKEKKRN